MSEVKENQVTQFKCPNCGGAIQFDPTAQKARCPFCGTELSMDVLQQMDEELNHPAQDDMNYASQPEETWTEEEGQGMHVYVCESCGGSIVADQNTAATTCPYCGNPVVLKGNLSGDLKPQYIIPFHTTKEQAKQSYYNFLTGKRLLPGVFKDQNHIEEIKGLYVPFWLFDADASTKASFKASKKIRAGEDKFYTDYYYVTRAGTFSFHGVPVDGSSQMPDDLMQSIEPFHTEELKDFHTSYLAGFYAEKYDVPKDECINTANQRIKDTAAEAIRQTVEGYDNVETQNSTVRLTNGQVHYALYPVWILNTNWNGQRYTFAMNGETGHFVGSLPVDEQAYKRYFLKSTAISTLILLGLSLLLLFFL